MTAFSEVQDYVERLTRQRVAELPDGTWETEDYIDYDPSVGEGMIPIKVKLTIEGDQIHYDLTGSHPAVGTFLNSCYGTTFSGVIAGTKTFFPDVPLNSGFYRVVQRRSRARGHGRQRDLADRRHRLLLRALREDHERDLRALVEDHSRARARLLVQPRVPARRRTRRRAGESKPIFMWYDWMVGGWGGRNGRDGSNGTAPIFGVGPRRPAARGPGAAVSRRSRPATRS